MEEMKVPEGWEKVQLQEVLTSVRNGFSGQQVEEPTEYKVTRIETISNGQIDSNRIGFVKSIPSEYKLQKNDLLFSNINSLKHIGKVAYVEAENHLYHGMNLLLLQFNEKVFPIYKRPTTRAQYFKKNFSNFNPLKPV